MLHDEIAEQGRFPGTGLSDHVKMMAAVCLRDAEEGGVATPGFSLADVNQVAIHGAQASRHSSRSWWNLA
jgi:hypothetical protein